LENNGVIKLHHDGIVIINKEALADMTVIHITPQSRGGNPDES
jgi:hypothetical protein